MDQPDTASLVTGVPNTALFVAVPVLANFGAVAWFTGYCQALVIPLWYISVSAVQLFIIGLFSLPIGWAALMLYLTLKRRGRTKRFDESVSLRALWIGGGSLALLALSYAWGYATPYATPRWAGVTGAPGCVILTRIGDDIIASDYDTHTRRLRGRLTLYAIDAVPTLDVYRVELDVRSGTAFTPSTTRPACPRAGQNNKNL